MTEQTLIACEGGPSDLSPVRWKPSGECDPPCVSSQLGRVGRRAALGRLASRPLIRLQGPRHEIGLDPLPGQHRCVAVRRQPAGGGALPASDADDVPGKASGVRPSCASSITSCHSRAGRLPPITLFMGRPSSLPTQTPPTKWAV